MKAIRPSLEVRSRREWRTWLSENHRQSEGIWLSFHRKDADVESITYEDAVEEALAFGWIDNIVKRVDDRTYVRRFTPRRPGSVWSRLNIERVGRLTDQGLMTDAGMEAYQRRTGKVSEAERIAAEGLTFPAEFEEHLRRSPKAWETFQKFGPSHRKRYLIWIIGAKRPETRTKRIEEAVQLITQNVKDLLK